MVKKIISLLLTCVVCTSLLTCAGAVSGMESADTAASAQAFAKLRLSALPSEVYDEVMSARTAAYLDLDAAGSAAERARILEARSTMISSQSWKADTNLDAVVLDVRTGAVTALPAFYDLFPADWEIPAGCGII